MCTHEIDQAPAFEALSYTWGQKVQHQIGCDDVEHNGSALCGHYLSIQESAWLALQRLRHETDERILWVDGICIRQTNLAEKNIQVLLMRNIFHKAKSVIVWLGEESLDSSAAFGLIPCIVAAAATEGTGSSIDAQRIIQPQDFSDLALLEHLNPAWEALESLFWRPWFTRVWVIQEIAVSRDASVLCGPSHCQWSGLVTTARYITDHSLTAITRVDPRRVIKYANLRQQSREGPPRSLLELLSQARDSYSTDDRDKIFALLGIAGDAEHSLLEPNYKKPLVDVYTKLTKQLIERDGTLDVLSAVEEQQFRLKRDRRLDNEIGGLEGSELPMDSQLPHWVPDWEVHRSSSPFPLHPAFTTMKAAAATQALCSFSTDGLTLHSRGIAFDGVAYVGDSFMEAIPASGSLFPNYRIKNVPLQTRLGRDHFDLLMEQRGRQWEKMAHDLRIYPTGEDILDTYIRTLVAGDALFLDLPQIRLRGYYTAWRKYWRIAGMNSPNVMPSSYTSNAAEEVAMATQFLQSQLKAACGRRFFTTSKGYMGLSQSGIRIGHTIAILHGGKTPYVLQRTGSRGYRFIGESYIHGLMNGEVLSMSLPEQEFAIR